MVPIKQKQLKKQQHLIVKILLLVIILPKKVRKKLRYCIGILYLNIYLNNFRISMGILDNYSLVIFSAELFYQLMIFDFGNFGLLRLSVSYRVSIHLTLGKIIFRKANKTI